VRRAQRKKKKTGDLAHRGNISRVSFLAASDEHARNKHGTLFLLALSLQGQIPAHVHKI